MRGIHGLSAFALVTAAAPACAAQYLEVNLETSAPVVFVDQDGDGNFLRYETDIYETTLHAVVDVADLEADGGYFPDLAGSILTGLSLDSSSFSAFTLADYGVALTFSYSVPLNGLDPETNFSRTFRDVGSYSADYSYSRYEIIETVGGTIGYASLRSFGSDTPVATAITFSQYFYPAPEPASWAMMLCGFGLTGGIMRYRRRQAMLFV